MSLQFRSYISNRNLFLSDTFQCLDVSENYLTYVKPCANSVLQLYFIQFRLLKIDSEW